MELLKEGEMTVTQPDLSVESSVEQELNDSGVSISMGPPLKADLKNDTCSSETESSGKIVFSPTVGIQRYLKVRETLDELIGEMDPDRNKSLLEVGCAAFKLHTYLKRMDDSVRRLMYMDIDEYTLEATVKNLTPFVFEHLNKRPAPLLVEAYAGDITVVDSRLWDVEPPIFSVVAIEVIEHLEPKVLKGFERTVFQILRPPTVIVTTPNSEFNVVFNLAPGKFRHWDHKFEWTRQEFHNWCTRICNKVSYGYSFNITGIGKGGPDTDKLGCVSQMAVFKRDMDDNVRPKVCSMCVVDSYKLMARIEYPFHVDTRTEAEKILQEYNYYVSSYVLNPNSVDDYVEEGLTEVKLSLERIQNIYGMPKDVTKSEIIEVLKKAGKDVRQDEKGGDHYVLLPVEQIDWPSNLTSDEECEDDSGQPEQRNGTEESASKASEADWDEEW